MIAGHVTRTIGLEFGAIKVQLQIVAQLEPYVDVEGLLRDGAAPEPPYWAHLWAGSRALARLVATELDCDGRRVAEPGCGVGLSGLVAARKGARVVMFDTARDAVRFAAANAALNACRVDALQANVERPPLRGKFDYCLAADLTYDASLQEAVAAFFAAHLALHGRAFCAESVRTHDTRLAVACERHGLQIVERRVREPDDNRDTEVRISEVTWPRH